MISNGFADCGNAGVQWSIPNELIGPALFKELVFGDNAVAMGKEIREHLKYFGPERYRLPGTEQFVALSVEDTVTKGIAHDFAPLASRQAHCVCWRPLKLEECQAPWGGAMMMGQKSNTEKNKNLGEILGIF
jgi:hypothetical protein